MKPTNGNFSTISLFACALTACGALIGCNSTAEPATVGNRLTSTPSCGDCGELAEVKLVTVTGQNTGLGAVAGGVAGIVVGNQIGNGDGKTIAKIAGAAGGAYLGNRIEKNVRSKNSYQLLVRMEDSSTRQITQESEPTLAIGAPVRVINGVVVAR